MSRRVVGVRRVKTSGDGGPYVVVYHIIVMGTRCDRFGKHDIGVGGGGDAHGDGGSGKILDIDARLFRRRRELGFASSEEFFHDVIRVVVVVGF